MKFLCILMILPLACLSCPDLIERNEWGSAARKDLSCMAKTASNVIIHHTHIPVICHSEAQCKNDMRAMQRFHMQERKWSDIAYNFCIGGKGEVYEGRGWGAVGYPINGYEHNSTGICFIGDYDKELPSENMLKSAKKLIECGIKMGYISQTPTVLGAREVMNTISPGAKLQNYIKQTRFGFGAKKSAMSFGEIY